MPKPNYLVPKWPKMAFHVEDGKLVRDDRRQRVNNFYKVSEKQYLKDFKKIFESFPHHPNQYEEIKLPERATKYSAGYDIFIPFNLMIEPGETITIPTGIKMQMDHDRFLMIVPRSGLGFKYQLGLANTVGIIDSDYYNNEDNEGHILVKLVNYGKKQIWIDKGEAFCQGILMSYDICMDDAPVNELYERKGGIGSTDNKEKSV